jgi:hypothetical protein
MVKSDYGEMQNFNFGTEKRKQDNLELKIQISDFWA